MVSLLKKPAERHSHGSAGMCDCIPYYFEKDGQEHFIKNLFVNCVWGEQHNEYDDRRSRTEMAQTLRELRKNGYSFYRFSGAFATIDGMIEYVREKGFSLTEKSHLDESYEYGFVDFQGDVADTLEHFFFRIFDPAIVETIKRVFPQIKTNS